MREALRAPWTSSEQRDINAALAALDAKLEDLSRRAAAGDVRLHWDALNLARSFASNTLKTDSAQLPGWQAAVARTAQSLASREPLALPMLEAWNRLLLGNHDTAVLRIVEQSLVGRRLLAVAEVPAALRDFEAHVLGPGEEHAVVRASRIYQWLISIHPFTNANGRTARLAADYVLIEAGYLPTVFPSPLSFSVALFPDRPRQVRPIEAFRGTVLAVERAAEILCL
jgi:hypothetical protein